MTGPGYPIATQSNCHSAASCLTPDTILAGVRFAPETNFRGASFPVARIFTCVPPTSTTRTFLASLLWVIEKGCHKCKVHPLAPPFSDWKPNLPKPQGQSL